MYLAQLLDMPVFDGGASLLIGLLLATVAVILSIECKGLLIGESASPEIIGKVEQILRSDTGITAINEILTMHMGPEDILLNLSVDFSDELNAFDVETHISALEKQIKSAYPTVKRIFIEAQRMKVHPGSLQ